MNDHRPGPPTGRRGRAAPHGIGGVWNTVLLPLQADDAIDFAALDAAVGYLCASGAQGLYTNGTAGEFHVQTEEEGDRIAGLVAERCRAAGVAFQLGISDANPLRSLERARRFRDLRPAAFQVVLPDWFPVTDDEADRFLDRIAEAADPVPLVLYNPPHAKRRLVPADLVRIAGRYPAVAGFKLPGGHRTWYEAMAPVLAAKSVFIPGHHLATGVLRGAHGSYSNVACLAPRANARWWDMLQRDPAAALRVERRVRRFFARWIRPLILRDRISNFAIDKLLAAVGGWGPVSRRVRWPYRSAEAETATLLRRRAHEELGDLMAWEQEERGSGGDPA